MKFIVPTLLLAFMLCISPGSRAGYVMKHRTAQTFMAETRAAAANTSVYQLTTHHTHDMAAPPRGRGNGSGAVSAFLYGWLSLIPALGLIAAVFACKNGFKNIGRIRKRRGMAIAGMVLATAGVALTILMVSIAFG